MFEQRADYAVPLLRLLADLPGGAGTREEVSKQFLQRFRSEIPKEYLELVPSGGEGKWRKHVGWTGWNLKNIGLIDAPERGVWRITQAGRDWLSEHPGVTHLSGPPQRRKRAASVREPRASTPLGTVAVPSGITLDKLERIRQVMPVDEFRHDWGDIYDQSLAAERAKAITPANDRYLLDRIRPLVQRIQDFLQERGNESPKSEVICDWIFICYTLELFREGAALWRYVNKDEVNAWQYERTAKFTATCRARAGS
jgi:hypothetical protein